MHRCGIYGWKWTIEYQLSSHVPYRLNADIKVKDRETLWEEQTAARGEWTVDAVSHFTAPQVQLPCNKITCCSAVLWPVPKVRQLLFQTTLRDYTTAIGSTNIFLIKKYKKCPAKCSHHCVKCSKLYISFVHWRRTAIIISQFNGLFQDNSGWAGTWQDLNYQSSTVITTRLIHESLNQLEILHKFFNCFLTGGIMICSLWASASQLMTEQQIFGSVFISTIPLIHTDPTKMMI